MTKVIGYIGRTIIFLLMFHIIESLQWHVKSENIVFGNDVLLYCDGIGCSSHSIKKWIGGPRYDLLCFNVTSTNSSKYEMIVQKNTSSFGLKIKDFTIYDVNCKYTCACGLQQHTHKLDLDALKYIYPPRIQNYSNLQTDDRCDIDLVIEVFPLPRCLIVYERNENKKMQDVPNAVLPVNFTSVPDKHLFFNNSRSSMYHLLVMHQRLMGIQNKYRGGNMYLTCTFEADLYQTVFRLNLTMCPEDHRTNTGQNIDQLSYIIAIAVTGIIVLFVFVMIMRRYVYQRIAETTSCYEYMLIVR